ncbi:MAG: hypothetical protein IKE94_01215 [Aeriscardovia sp.]|nr:hypothetical protein [Aeriscardovia sp.]
MAERISWNRNQRKRIQNAVRSYNSAITKMERSGLYDLLPNRTSVEREMALIETRGELRQRIKELGRILVKNKKDAQKPVELLSNETGELVTAPKYLIDEIKLAVRSINERRSKLRLDILGSSEWVNTPEYVTGISGKNLKDIDETHYQDGDDLDDLWEEEYPHTFAYAEQYKVTWMEYNGNRMVSDIIDWFARYEPEALKRIFESGDDEVDIHYIYPDYKSYDKTPMIIRHNRIIAYWNEAYREYSGGYHADYGDWTRDDE